MFDGSTWVLSLCDKCHHREGGWGKLAYSLMSGIRDENGGWIDGYTPEKVQQSQLAFAEAEKRLATWCLRIECDCDNVTICQNCLEQLKNSRPETL